MEEIDSLVESLKVSVLIIGIRRRSPIGKLIMGSVAQELLMTISCPILAVCMTLINNLLSLTL